MKQHKLFSFLSLGIGSLATILSLSAALVAMPNISTAREIQVASATEGALAKELQGKPVVVDIYATWCPGCKNIAPTLSQIKQQYKNTAHFVVFDVSDKSTTQASQAKAKKLGLSEFFAANKSQTSTVAIIDPATGKILKQFRNNPNQKDYTTVLDTAIAQMQKQ